ncbi:MAG: Rdx family protein [Pirellulales bacterium]|nr:Rdx family protein [Pirellulales bacterium]
MDSLELIPASGGAFELTIGEELIYSKLETGSFPDEAEMIEEVGKRV